VFPKLGKLAKNAGSRVFTRGSALFHGNARSAGNRLPANDSYRAKVYARQKVMKILLLSDIHGNWAALQAVLAAEPDVDQILCLGDLVNYGPQPAECVAWAMKTLALDRLIQL
jgi:hypothetical protein